MKHWTESKYILVWKSVMAGALFAVLAVGTEAAEADQRVEPSAEAVWGHLQEVEYQESWSHWPGTTDFYEGTEPHGMLLTTYVNQVAQEALDNRNVPLPVGSMIVKENYKPTKELAAVTIMYKPSEEYNPKHNNWFWMKRLADGTVEASGKVESCQGCHGTSKTDYLMTPLPK